jgi:hypothetical protein
MDSYCSLQDLWIIREADSAKTQLHLVTIAVYIERNVIDGRVNLSYLGNAGAFSNQRYLLSIVWAMNQGS